ncbi:hypothetical protein C3L33_16936, partial [Rhododendron williamsianum]
MELVVEEWSGSSSTKLTRTAIITASPSSIAIRRSGSRFNQISRRFLQAFGYPSSVTPDYAPFQMWDLMQGLSTYIRTMLSTQALLSAIGVGEKSATVIGATFQGSNLDSNAKMWRLIADFMNDLVHLSLWLGKSRFSWGRKKSPRDVDGPCFSFISFSICVHSLFGELVKIIQVAGVASGATRAALTQHFALQNNAADISAKEGSQETVATMIGMALGMLLAHVTMGYPLAIWLSFLSLTMFHMVSLMESSGSHYKKAKYLLLERKGTVSIVMHKDSIATDVLQAFLHALVMANLFDEHQSAHSESHSWMDKHYQNLVVKVKLQSSGWKTERLLSPSIIWRANWVLSSDKID